MNRPYIKICGITRLEDAQLAISLGSWAIGFILWPKSPRFIKPQDVKLILSRLPRFVQSVGVFVNPSIEEANHFIEASGISMIQFHGNESPQFCGEFRLPVIKAFRPQGESDLPIMMQYQQQPFVQAVLIDAYVPGQYGGTGKLADWNLASKLSQYGDVILSGGLGPSNIRNALQDVSVFGVDASSSLEDQPGIKNSEKMIQFFKAIREK